jgi:FAD synthase
MKSFSRYEKSHPQTYRGVVLTWGRFNPPTVGHEAMFNEAARVANELGFVLRIVPTHSHDNEKNPLLYEKKVEYLRTLFPRYASYVMETQSRTIMDVMSELREEFTELVMVVGDDRVEAFSQFMKQTAEELNFSFWKIQSAGRRDPDADGVEGMSASLMREYVTKGDFTQFKSGLPSSTDTDVARSLFEDVRRGLGIREKYVPVALERTPEREAFYAGQTVSKGDTVIIEKTGAEGTVCFIGANYVMVESEGKKTRHWSKDIKRVNHEERT